MLSVAPLISVIPEYRVAIYPEPRGPGVLEPLGSGSRFQRVRNDGVLVVDREWAR